MSSRTRRRLATSDDEEEEATPRVIAHLDANGSPDTRRPSRLPLEDAAQMTVVMKLNLCVKERTETTYCRFAL